MSNIDIRYNGLLGWEVFDTGNGASIGWFDNFEKAFGFAEKLTDARNNVTIASSNGEDNNIEEGVAFCENSAKN